ncbi:DUF2341 domain-containing protein [Candidatus Roizmanbacteria bacterium]|nr:DUF2341 domain-containing protein [Candidatus Roizmanbacteria bacterium]
MKKLWDLYIGGIEKGIYSSFERISSSFRLARNLWGGVKKGFHVIPACPESLFRGMTHTRHSGSPGHRFVSTLSFRLRPESLLKGLLRQSPCSFLAMTKRRPFLFASFGIIILLFPLLFLVLKYRPFSAQAGWFNDSWAYRQTVSLVNTGSAQTDFQVMIATDSASMINAGRLKNDCSDIRITDLNGKKLPYWVEPNTCNTAQTKIWTKVPSIPASTGTATSSTVFLYYGNPNATTESNQKNVFIREISNVVGAWNMDESSWNGTAGEVKDSSGNGNNGQAQGGAITANGKFGNSGSFNGTSGYVNIPNINAANGYTASSWVYLNNTNNMDIYGDELSFKGMGLQVNGGTFYTIVSDGTSPHRFSVGYTPSASTWYYVVQTFSMNAVKTYVNGQLVNTTAYTLVQQNGLTFRLGKSSNGSFFNGFMNGRIDEFRIYSKNISPSEISDLYGTGGDRLGYTTPNYPGKELVRKYSSAVTYNLSAVETGGTAPIAYWKFDEGQGTVAKNSMGLEGLVTNLVTNPSFETGTTGWGTYNATFTQISSGANASFPVVGTSYASVNVTNTSYAQAVINYYLSNPPQFIPGATYTFSVNVDKGSYTGTVSMLLKSTHDGYVTGTYSTVVTVSTPGRYSTTMTVPANDTNMQISVQATGGTGTYYIDGAQLELSSSASPYCDGSITNSSMQGRWNGTAHASTSTCTYTAGDGTINGATWQTEDQCVSGKCLSFSSTTNNYVDIGSNKFDTLSNATLEMWFNYKGTFDTNRLLFYHIKDSNNRQPLFVSFSGGYGNKLVWENIVGGNYRGIKSKNTIASNTWYHLSLTCGSGGMRMYLNGILQETNATTDCFQSIAPTTYNRIGYNNTSFIGNIDDVKIYPYARTPAQVKADYNAGKGKAAVAKGASVNLGTNKTQGDFLSNGLVGYWKMDEATWSGTLAEVKDASGNGNNGQAQGATGGKAYPAGGKFGNGGYFDGVDDYASVPTSTSLNIGGSEITMSAWIYPKAFSNTFIIRKETPGYNMGLTSTGNVWSDIYYYFDTQWRYDTCITTQALTANQWYHLVTVFKQNQYLNIYVNNQLYKSCKPTYNSPIGVNATAPLLIGYMGWWGNNNGYFSGTIDELRLYNRALSPSEVSALYNWAPGPVGYWKLDDKTGTTAVDSSGYGNNGTLTCNGTGCTSANYPVWKNSKDCIYGSCIYSPNGAPKQGYISVAAGSSSNLNFRTSDFTLEGWAKLTTNNAASGMARLFGSYPHNGHNGSMVVTIENSNNMLSLTARDLSGNVSYCQYGFTNYLNKWTYISWVKTGNRNVSLYLNGNLAQSWTTPYDFYVDYYDDTYTLAYGSGVVGGAMYLDDHKTYNYARTQKQIVEDMNGGDPAGTNKSMVGYWKFDEGSGNTANNTGLGGSILNGTLYNTTWTPAGKFGKALNFNGSTSYVDMGNPSDGTLNFGANSFSLSTWIKTTAVGYQRIVSKGHTGFTNGYLLQLYSGTGYIDTGIGAGGVQANSLFFYASGKAVNDNMWHHVVSIFDQINKKALVYIDGIPTALTKVSGTCGTVMGTYLDISACTSLNATTSNRFNIGSGFGIEYFNGSIDEVKVYNYPLTADEVKEDYNKGSAMVLGAAGDDTTSLTNGLLGWWKMDEASWNGTVNEVKDSSGNGRTMTAACASTYWPGCTIPSTTTGKYGNAGSFSTSQEQGVYRSTPFGNISANSSQSGFAWIKPNNRSYMYSIINKRWGGVDSGQSFYIDTNGALILTLESNGSRWNLSSPNNSIPTGTWTHVGYGIDRITKKASIYINGVSVGTPISISNVGDMTNPSVFSIAFWGGIANYFFDGFIDDVRLYNRGLTATEVAQLYTYNPANQLVSRNSNAALYCIPGDTSYCSPPVAEYNFDEGGGSTVYDTSGNNNNGTWNGTGKTHYVHGKQSKAGNFNGVDDYVSINDSSSLNSSTFTLSFWVKKNSEPNDWGMILDKIDWTSGTAGYNILFGPGPSARKVYLSMSNTSGAATNTHGPNTQLPIGVWRFYTYTFDGTSIGVYENGILIRSVAFSGTWVPYANPLLISRKRNGNNNYSPISLDQVRIYNYARTPAQVAYDYNRGAPIAWWKMDECQGTTVSDASGNGNTGTLLVGSGGTQTQPGTCTDGNSASAWNNGKNGKFGSSLNFDGSDDYVDMGNPTSLQITNQITLTGWAYITDLANYRPIISKGRTSDVTNRGSFQLYSEEAADQKSSFTLYTTYEKRLESQSITTGWHNIVGTYDGSTMKIYIDGKLSNSGSMSGSIKNSSYNVLLGSEKDNAGNLVAKYNNKLDDVRIYNYALTASQVQNVFNEGAAVRFGPSTGSGP